jgi:O-antigen/teichoic acid export membrane protein
MAILGMLYVVILTRSLTTKNVGIYFLLIQITNVTSLFCKCGTDQGSQKFIGNAIGSQHPVVSYIVKKLLVVVGITTTVTLILLALGWKPIDRFFFDGDYTLCFWALGITAVLAYEHTISSILRAIDNVLQASLVLGVFRQTFLVLALGTLVISTKRDVDLASVLQLWVIGGAIGIFIGGYLVVRGLKSLESSDSARRFVPSVREMMTVAMPMGLANGAAVIRGSSDTLIIGAILGPVAVGLYGPIKRISRLVILILESVVKMLSPMVAELFAQGKIAAIEAVCRTGASYACLAAVPVTVGFILFGEALLTMLFGGEYGKLDTLLLLIIVGPLVRAIMGSPGAILQMVGQQMLVLKINVIITAMTIGVMVAVCRPFGINGIAVVSSTTVSLQVILLSVFVYRILGIKTYAYARPKGWARDANVVS